MTQHQIEKHQIEKHQYGFAIMNTRTGGIKRKSFWGSGKDENECKINARKQANDYSKKLSDEAYDKACRKDTSGYLPSKSSYEFEIVGCTLWK